MNAIPHPTVGVISIIWKPTMPSSSLPCQRSMFVRMTRLLSPYSNICSTIRLSNKSIPIRSSNMEERYIVQPGIIIIHYYLHFQLRPLQRMKHKQTGRGLDMIAATTI